MTIPFKNVPANIRVPLFYAEVDNSQANSATGVQRTLIIGGTTTNTDVNVPRITQGVGDVRQFAGAGSLLHLMAAAYRRNDNFGELWILPIQDDGGAVAAVSSLQVTASPTAAGVISLYIGDTVIQIAVAAGLTLAQCASAINAAVVANGADLPVTSAIDGAVAAKVNFTAKNKGVTGNEIKIALNYLGPSAGEITPIGFTATLTQPTAGAVNPSLATALSNLNDKAFDFIICPYNDTTPLDTLRDFLDDITGRWSWKQELFGHVWAARRGSLSALVTFGNGRNNQHETIIGFNGGVTPAWIWAAASCGAAAVSLRNDPGQPLQTLNVSGVLAPELVNRFTLEDRNALLYNGIATHYTQDNGSIRLENIITTYQKNAFSQPDDSYLEVETLYLLMFVLRFLKTRVTSRFSRMKLADNGTRIAPGSNVVTPNIIRADQVAAFQELEELGMVQRADDFVDNLIVERNAQNPNRVDVLWPGALINQLRIFALLAQFRL